MIEAKCLKKARKVGVGTPVLYAVDTISHSVTFEYVEGLSVKDHFHKFGLKGVGLENTYEFALQIGNTIGKLHDGGVVHGDLTTSNMLWRDGKMVLIDFGLSFVSTLPENKAIDLYVLEQALMSIHSLLGNVVFQGGGYVTALVMVVAGTDGVLEVIGFVHFVLKKYNRLCVILCFRNSVCESGVISV
ncbi:Kae1-associated kinase Bud32 [Artemisia annua]|uniref:non-specific serine/threonine protein kinase n=1 Tax=Artemisia annua TaxID=35608 RepID=A0A2U1N2F9_ARTAN|nr:Kae1-associated kinase Bud32 [Artemisia annua]